VRTIISSNCREVCGARTDHSNIGQPLKHRMFLRGILLLPPRAGIIAIVFRGSVGMEIFYFKSVHLLRCN
jgi:hypothetical protein